MNELIDGEVARNRCKESFDRGLVAINVQKSTNDLRSAERVDTLYVHFDELD